MTREPIIIEFPLRGEWNAPTTPGDKIPSHGTHKLGTTYAFDFLQVDWHRKGTPSYQGNLFQYIARGVPLQQCYCWKEKIYAPCDGEVMDVVENYPERKNVKLIADVITMLKNTKKIDKNSFQEFAGNYIILKCKPGVYAAFAHLQTKSIQVSIGQHVEKGDYLGNVGHSGNSMFPHLHFQLMDRANVLEAKGIPCVFERYEIFENNKWKKVVNGIPRKVDRIRFYKE